MSFEKIDIHNLQKWHLDDIPHGVISYSAQRENHPQPPFFASEILSTDAELQEDFMI